MTVTKNWAQALLVFDLVISAVSVREEQQKLQDS